MNGTNQYYQCKCLFKILLCSFCVGGYSSRTRHQLLRPSRRLQTIGKHRTQFSLTPEISVHFRMYFIFPPFVSHTENGAQEDIQRRESQWERERMWEKATRFRFSRALNRQTGDDSMLEWWRIDTNTHSRRSQFCTAVWKHTNARTGNHNWTLIEHGTSFLSVPLAHWRDHVTMMGCALVCVRPQHWNEENNARGEWKWTQQYWYWTVVPHQYPSDDDDDERHQWQRWATTPRKKSVLDSVWFLFFSAVRSLMAVNYIFKFISEHWRSIQSLECDWVHYK